MKRITLSPLLLLLFLHPAVFFAQSDSAKTDTDEVIGTSLTFRPQLRSLQVDLLKLLALDLLINLDVDVLCLGDRYSFGLRSQYLNRTCSSLLSGDGSCDQYLNYSALLYGSIYFPSTDTDNDCRLTLTAGLGSVLTYESQPLLEHLYPVIGLEAQIRLPAWFSATADYFLVPGFQESMDGYMPVGVRMGYARW